MRKKKINEYGRTARRHTKKFLIRQKLTAPFRKFAIILAGSQVIDGKRNILTCQMFLIFILLNWINDSYAYQNQLANSKSYQKKCGVVYNPSKTAAIVGGICGRAEYVSSRIKEPYVVAEQNRGFYVKWLDDRVATLEAGCGTGCLAAYIFIAPSTVVSCSSHDYRIDMQDPHEPPDYSHNRPLLVDPKKQIYVCYDGDGNIQVFPFPKEKTIHPPSEYFSERAVIQGEKLIVIYHNKHGATKQIGYQLD